MLIGLDLEEKIKATPELFSQDVVMSDSAFPRIVSVWSLSEKVADSSTGQQEVTSQNEKRKRKIKVFNSRPLTHNNASCILNPIALITLDDDGDEAEGNQKKSSQVKTKKTKLSTANTIEKTVNSLQKVLPEYGFTRQVVENNIPTPNDDIQILDNSSDENDSGSGSSPDDSSGSCHDDDTSKKTNPSVSSTSSSDEGSKNCVPFANTLRKLFGKSSFEREVEDQKTDVLVPRDGKDADDESCIELNERGEMKCYVCPTVFKNKYRYLMHRRRHFALDHFICPTCSKGFIKFSHCQAHELKKHHENSQIGPASYAFRTTNAGNFNETETADLNGKDLPNRIVISSSLYPYRGPLVVGQYTPYEIELKYSKSERKSHSTVVAKYALECQRKLRMEAANQRRIDESEQKCARRTVRSYPEDQVQDSSDDDLGSDSENIPDILNQTNKNKKTSTATNTNKEKPAATGEPGKRQWYYCRLCDCQGYEKCDIEEHARLRHSNLPMSDVVKFIYYESKIPENLSQGKFETKSVSPSAAPVFG